MSKRNLTMTRTHKIFKLGGKSYVATLPVEFIRDLGWKEGQKIDLTLEGDKIVISDWKG